MTPILLIPGLLCSAEVFAPQIAALWPYGPVTVASTIEGVTIAEMAARILAEAPPQFALAGISMGGYVCFEMMRQAPQRVIKLALLDTSARPDTPEQTVQRRAAIEQVQAGDFPAMLAEALRAMVHPAHQADAVLRATFLRMGLAVGVEGFRRQQEAMIERVDSRPHLAAVSVATLVLVGEQDPLTPPDRAEEIAGGIGGARLVVVPECGHMSTLERPEAVNRALIDWIKWIADWGGGVGAEGLSTCRSLSYG